MNFSRYHKIQNPVLHPFGVAGFWVTIDHFKSSFPNRVERRNLVREYFWLLFIANSSKSQWKLGPLTTDCAAIHRYGNRRVWHIRPFHFGFWIADCGFHVFGAIIRDGFDRYGQNRRIFFKKMICAWWFVEEKEYNFYSKMSRLSIKPWQYENLHYLPYTSTEVKREIS